MRHRKSRRKSDKSPRLGERRDEQGVRERLEDTIEKQFGARSRRRVQREVRWVIERAHIPWNTFYKKLKGDRRIQDADVPLFARALGLNPLWLATGRGPALDDRPLEPLVVTVGWAPYKRPRGRPRKHPDPKLQFRLDAVQRDAQEKRRDQLRKDLAERNPYNPVEWKKGRSAWEGWLDRTVEELVLLGRRVTGEAEPEPPTRVEKDEMGKRLAAKPILLSEPLSFPRLALLDEFVAVALAQAEPRRRDLEFLLNVAEHLDTQLHKCWPFKPGLESGAEHEHRQPLRLLNDLKGELRAALEDLEGAETEPPPWRRKREEEPSEVPASDVPPEETPTTEEATT